MSRLTWFPFYVEDFRVSTMELKTDEIGVYFTMLVLCYARGGPLPGNDDELKFILQRQIANFHGHSYNRIVKKLLGKYFYRDEKGDWRQKRVEIELERAREFIQKQRDRVTKRWASDVEIDDKSSANTPQTSRKRSANASQIDERSLKSNDIAHTNNNTIHNNISTNVDIAAPAKPKRAKPKSKISEDAQPTDRDRQSAAEAGLSGEAFRTEWRRFRDYHISRGSLMADWQAAWRTWLGNHDRFAKPARDGPGRKIDAITAAIMNLESSPNETQAARPYQAIQSIPFDGEYVTGGLGVSDT